MAATERRQERFHPVAFASILEGALAIVQEPDPHAKAALADALYNAAPTLPLRPPRGGGTGDHAHDLPLTPPARPARLPLPSVVAPAAAPKRGKGGTPQNRAAMLHSLVHIESWAVDLAADFIARFACARGGGGGGGIGGGGGQQQPCRLNGRRRRRRHPHHPHPQPPRALALDFVAVAADEARHFSILERRLNELGYRYGDFPVHDGLWESAERTSRCPAARLAVEHCTHEARGLDVLPTTILRFRRGGDEATAALLETVVYPEEVRHCAAGVRWLTWMHHVAVVAGSGGCGRREEEEAMRRACAAAGPPEGVATVDEAVAAVLAEEEEWTGDEEAGTEDEETEEEEEATEEAGAPAGGWRADAARHGSPPAWFRSLVARHFNGRLKPPFNVEARARAGFTPEWYEEGEKGANAAAAADEDEDDAARRRGRD
jgi:uncharacterized ferritin-like protein (DUF455 family)